MNGQSETQVWFPDTCALVTMAVHTPLGDDVRAQLGAKTVHRVLLEAVVGELEGLTKAGGREGAWAAKALGELGWLKTPVGLDDLGVNLALELQELIRGSRPLRHPMEHWGEAAILALASRAKTLTPVMLSDDYNARLAAADLGVKPVSVHKLLSLMVRKGCLDSARAASHVAALHANQRGFDYTEAELRSGRLGRVGEP